MNDKKTRFYVRVPASVLAELKRRAKQQGVPVQDLARFCLERSLAITSLEAARDELIRAAQGLIAASGNPARAGRPQDGSLRAGLKSILFTEQYLRSLALKEPDPVTTADRVTARKLKELNI